MSFRDGFRPDFEILPGDVWGTTGEDGGVGRAFIKRLGGMAGMSLVINKLMVFMFSDVNEDGMKFFGLHSPTILFTLFSNLCLLIFEVYVLTICPPTMHSSTKIKIFALAFETTLIGSSYYLNYLRHVKLGDMLFRRPLPQSAPSTVTDKKTDEPISTEIADPSNNVPSRIIVRTTWVCSTVFAIPFFRDLLFPGQVLKWFPGDVQYLIFVKAYVHSPPSSVYNNNHLMFIGDKVTSQHTGLLICLLCLFKMTTALLIKQNETLGEYWKKGWDSGSGMYKLDASKIRIGTVKQIQCLKLQFFGNFLVWMTMFRYYHAAMELEGFKTNHHLIVIFWETFVLFMYAWF